MPHRLAAFAAVAALIGALLYVFCGGKPGSAPFGSNPRVSNEPRIVAWDWDRLRSPSAAVAPAVAPTATPWVRTGALLALYRSPDWTPAIRSLLEHPEQGGTFYAARMLSWCRAFPDLRAIWQETSPRPSSDEQSNAREAMARRCAGDLSQFPSSGELAAVQDDPLRAAESRLGLAWTRKPRDAMEFRQALSEVLATGDPLLIDTLGLRLVVRANRETGRPEFRFAGRSYPLTGDLDVGLAMHLAPCELGLPCDMQEDPMMLLRCASGAGCDGSRTAEAARMSAADPERLARVQSLAHEIAAAIRNRDVSAFTD